MWSGSNPYVAVYLTQRPSSTNDVDVEWAQIDQAVLNGRSCATSEAHCKLMIAVERGNQARRSSLEGGLLDVLVIVTKDNALLNLLSDGEHAKSVYPSWTIHVHRPASNGGIEDLISAILVLTRASHAVGSPQNAFFQLVSELRVGSHAVNSFVLRSASNGIPEDSDGRDAGMMRDLWGGLRSLWSLDVPSGAGSAGYGSSSNLHPTAWKAWKGIAEEGRERPALDNESRLCSWAGGLQAVEERELQFLPTSAEIACQRIFGGKEDWATSDLMRRLEILQHHPSGCRRARRARFPNHGAAATMHYLIIQLKRGFREGRPISFQGQWIYSACPGGNVSCIFQSETSCPIPDWVEERQANTEVFAIGEEQADHLSSYDLERKEELDPHYLPPMYQVEGKTVFWYNSMFSGFLFKLTKSLETAVFRTQSALGLISGEKYVGVQIRRGDACGQTRPCVQLDLYASAVTDICQRYNIWKVYLASDSSDAIAELKELLPEKVEIVYQALDREYLEEGTHGCGSLVWRSLGPIGRHVGCEWIEDKLARASQEDKATQIRGVIVDISLLAEADAFVGTFTSALSRMAFQLSFAKKGYVKPFISLDIPWCWAGFHLIDVPWGSYGC